MFDIDLHLGHGHLFTFVVRSMRLRSFHPKHLMVIEGWKGRENSSGGITILYASYSSEYGAHD
jgi:hypothetical protein